MKKRIYTAMMALAAAAVVAMGGGSSIDARAKWLPEKNYECEAGHSCGDETCYCYGIMRNGQKNIVLEVAKQIVAAAPASAHEKVKYFHDTICQYATYTLNSSFEITSPYGVFINRQAKCVGYAESLKMLCDMAGIPCMTVDGMINNGTTGHEWNIVQLEDGQWYEIDCTFDDNNRTGNLSYKWFLVTTEQMNKDHSRGTPWGRDQSNIPFAYGTQLAYSSINTGDVIKDNDFRFTINSNGTVILNEVPHTKNLTIPDSITYKGKEFIVTEIDLKRSGRTGVLRSITIGKNVTSIKKDAFNGCNHLKKVIIKSEKIENIGKNAFKDTSKKITVNLPRNCYKKYKKVFQKKSGISKTTKFKKI